MPRAIVHAPHKLAGLNEPNLYTEQLATQLTMLLCYGPQSEKTMEMMGILISALAILMMLEVGLVGEIMMTPGLFKPVLTDMWLKQLWIDCLHYGLNIQTDLLEFKPNCSNDIELMQVFAQHGY